MKRKGRHWLQRRVAACLLASIAFAGLAGCVSFRDPLEVTVAGIESLPGEGMELRMLVTLRVQNPNDAPVEFDGVAVQMSVQGKKLATGVSDAQGTVARFGEALVEVPVTISAFRMARQAIGLMSGRGGPGKITFEMAGKLHGPVFRTVRFRDEGELALPTGEPGE
jgi:LEA14-like dessication related protein